MADILFTEKAGLYGTLGFILLNRPSALNALTHEMILDLYDQLNRWQQEDHIKGVILEAAPGRAFCAGGDIRWTYEQMLSQNPNADQFFQDEYRLNRLIHHYQKPYISFWDGITMGGGAGISVHGSHRLASDKLLFAMPETGIGFYPDVGGTYFLSRIPHFFGYYLALTGARIGCDDAVYLGLATHKVKSEDFNNIKSMLLELDFGTHPKLTVSQALENFSQPDSYPPLKEHVQWIETTFSEVSLDDIVELLAKMQNSFASEILKQLDTKSPTSLKVTLQALLLAEEMDFDECMEEELRLTHYFLRQNDFKEGIRALIIDKDQRPIWKPSQLNEVDIELVSQYFQPVDDYIADQ